MTMTRRPSSYERGCKMREQSVISASTDPSVRRLKTHFLNYFFFSQSLARRCCEALWDHGNCRLHCRCRKEIYRDSSRNVRSRGDGCEGREKLRGDSGVKHLSTLGGGGWWPRALRVATLGRVWPALKRAVSNPFQTRWTYLVSKQVYSSLIDMYVRMLLGIWIWAT